MENSYNWKWLLRVSITKPSSFCLLAILLLGLINSANAQTLLPKTSSKYQVAYQVFERLTYAFANGRPQPELEIIARNPKKYKVIAMYRPGNHPVVQLDEEVYDLCLKLKKDSLNALAVLLSHELAHHYEKHDWYYTFGIGQANSKMPKEYIQQFESEADFYGCFYGELSGFATGRVFPKVLDMIYQQFDLSDRLSGYPTKEERKAVYASRQKEAIQMVSIFKAGSFLYLIQEFGSAAQCFEYLVNKFPSREIYNNLAAAKLQQALALYTTNEKTSFVYPVEMDAQSRLVVQSRTMTPQFNLQQFNQLLVEARRYAEQAKEVDPLYVPAYINLACIYSLQGNQPAAIGIINELGPDRITGDAYTIRAIAYFKDDQFTKAQKDFEMALQRNAHMGKCNLDLANKLHESLTASLAMWIMGWFEEEDSFTNNERPASNNHQERIGGKRRDATLPTQAPKVRISKNPNLVIQWNELNDHLQIGIQNNNRNYLMCQTLENYFQPTARRVKQGTPSTTIAKQYGKPTYTFAGTMGEYWIYTNNKIAFNLDKNGKVNSWLIYTRTL